MSLNILIMLPTEYTNQHYTINLYLKRRIRLNIQQLWLVLINTGLTMIIVPINTPKLLLTFDIQRSSLNRRLWISCRMLMIMLSER
ncbi:hypothetical protein FIV04_18430 (plasmid) [Vibrio sp. THAF190c]|nr:hypothetical protein FIV04_18430 [Vibrio sp. THAF190c]